MPQPLNTTLSPSRTMRLLFWLLRPSVSIPLALLILLVAAPLAYRSSQTAGLGGLEHPFDLEEFSALDVNPEDNAHTDYRAAGALLKELPSSELQAQQDVLEFGWPSATQGVRKWLEDNRPALQLWQQGTEKPSALSQPIMSYNMSALPQVRNLREFARLARMEGYRLEHDGDLEGAWTWYRAMFRCSRHSSMNCSLIERLIGNSIHAIVATAMERWSRDPRVTAAMLRRALAEIEDDYRMTSPDSVMLKIEYIALCNALGTTKPDEFAHAMQISGSELDPRLARAWFFLKNEPTLTRLVLRPVYANWLAQADKPFNERPPRRSPSGLYDAKPLPGNSTPELSAAQIERILERSLIVNHFLPPADTLDESLWRERARQAALTAALAAQLFQRKHGRYPHSAPEVINSGILPSFPQDPLAKPGTSISYRRTQDGFVVWSIGPDGKDDGGKVEWSMDGFVDTGFRIAPDEPAEAEQPEPDEFEEFVE